MNLLPLFSNLDPEQFLKNKYHGALVLVAMAPLVPMSPRSIIAVSSWW